MFEICPQFDSVNFKAGSASELETDKEINSSSTAKLENSIHRNNTFAPKDV